MADIRRVIAFVATAGTICFVAWVGGIDFDERSELLAVTICSALCLGGVASAYPFQEKSR